MTDSQFARTPDPRLARQVPPRQVPGRPVVPPRQVPPRPAAVGQIPPRQVPPRQAAVGQAAVGQAPVRYGQPVDPRNPSFRRTVGAEITRHAQQHQAYAVPQRRTPAEDTALATLLRSRQRAESARQDPRPADLTPRPDPWMRTWPSEQEPGRGDVIEQLSSRLVSANLWAVVEPLIPPAKVRRQGGGRGRVCNRSVFTAIVFVLSSGCAWRHLPASFGVTVPTVHRRFQEWTDLGLWVRLRRAAAEGAFGADELDWVRAVLDAADRRAAKAAG
ncbi:Putative transposase of IS4/5 family [Lentzea albidocapillata subsp. violacea]|uniref:Putative transposase of IS4/5 family n=1 Tax=Lentzea albidocapillata subsp. violacea TaxID=128104 RepID=A0A1G8ZSQ6_9PSEU|nr:Putative transposase of IS4/5 family [Lentzea albidocapillata subsp. violacea]